MWTPSRLVCKTPVLRRTSPSSHPTLPWVAERSLRQAPDSRLLPIPHRPTRARTQNNLNKVSTYSQPLHGESPSQKSIKGGKITCPRTTDCTSYQPASRTFQYPERVLLSSTRKDKKNGRHFFTRIKEKKFPSVPNCLSRYTTVNHARGLASPPSMPPNVLDSFTTAPRQAHHTTSLGSAA